MAAENVKDFSILDCSLNFAAINLNQGAGEGDFVKFEKVDPDFKTKTGSDGSVVRIYTGTTLWKVTLTLLQTSAINAILAGINALDVTLRSGVAPLFFKNNRGVDTFASPSAWIEKPADAAFGADGSNREWVIYAYQGLALFGGS